MLQGYLEELRKTSLLEPEEELELWRRDAAGDEAAHQRLMTAYQPLVFKIASSFRLPEADTMELIQEGMVGLLEAAESYDYKRQVAFSLFASYRIRGSMVDYLRHSTDKGMLYLDSELSKGFTLSDALPSELASQRGDGTASALRKGGAGDGPPAAEGAAGAAGNVLGGQAGAGSCRCY